VVVVDMRVSKRTRQYPVEQPDPPIKQILDEKIR